MLNFQYNKKAIMPTVLKELLAARKATRKLKSNIKQLL